jgi:hypothetical protein
MCRHSPHDNAVHVIGGDGCQVNAKGSRSTFHQTDSASDP